MMPPSPLPPTSWPSDLLTLRPLPFSLSPWPSLAEACLLFSHPRQLPQPPACQLLPPPRSTLFKMSSDFITPSLETLPCSPRPFQGLETFWESPRGIHLLYLPASPQLPSCVYSGTRVLKPEQVSEPPLHLPPPLPGLVKITTNHSLYKLPTS